MNEMRRQIAAKEGYTTYRRGAVCVAWGRLRAEPLHNGQTDVKNVAHKPVRHRNLERKVLLSAHTVANVSLYILC